MSPQEKERISNVYKEERRRLLGYIRNRVPADIEAEDILQDIFYQLTLGFRDLMRIENLTAWIYRVADNRIINLFRKKKPHKVSYREHLRNEEEEPLYLEDILPSLDSLPEDDEIRDLIWQAIDKTLAGLPEEQRQVFIDHEFSDLSFNDISVKTGVTINTLISRKRYAVLALRENLNELYKLLITK